MDLVFHRLKEPAELQDFQESLKFSRAEEQSLMQPLFSGLHVHHLENRPEGEKEGGRRAGWRVESWGFSVDSDSKKFVKSREKLRESRARSQEAEGPESP